MNNPPIMLSPNQLATLDSVWHITHTYMYWLIDYHRYKKDEKNAFGCVLDTRPIDLWSFYCQYATSHNDFALGMQDLTRFRDDQDCEKTFRFLIKKAIWSDQGFECAVRKICTFTSQLDTMLAFRVWALIRPNLCGLVENTKSSLEAQALWSLLQEHSCPQNVALTEFVKGVNTQPYPGARQDWMISVYSQIKKELHETPALANAVKAILKTTPDGVGL